MIWFLWSPKSACMHAYMHTYINILYILLYQTNTINFYLHVVLNVFFVILFSFINYFLYFFLTLHTVQISMGYCRSMGEFQVISPSYFFILCQITIFQNYSINQLYKQTFILFVCFHRNYHIAPFFCLFNVQNYIELKYIIHTCHWCYNVVYLTMALGLFGHWKCTLTWIWQVPIE